MGSTPTPLHIPKLDSVTFDTLLERHNPFSSTDCTFDLTGVEFIAPSAEVQLAAACYGLAREGRRPLIVMNDEALRAYLIRSGFIQVVQPVAQFQPLCWLLGSSVRQTRVFEKIRCCREEK